jgi:hypothetical protein
MKSATSFSVLAGVHVKPENAAQDGCLRIPGNIMNNGAMHTQVMLAHFAFVLHVRECFCPLKFNAPVSSYTLVVE